MSNVHKRGTKISNSKDTYTETLQIFRPLVKQAFKICILMRRRRQDTLTTQLRLNGTANPFNK